MPVTHHCAQQGLRPQLKSSVTEQLTFLHILQMTGCVAGPLPLWRTHLLDPASCDLGITWPGFGMWERLSTLTTDLLSNCPRSSSSAHSQAFQDRQQNHPTGGALIPELLFGAEPPPKPLELQWRMMRERNKLLQH